MGLRLDAEINVVWGQYFIFTQKLLQLTKVTIKAPARPGVSLEVAHD